MMTPFVFRFLCYATKGKISKLQPQEKKESFFIFLDDSNYLATTVNVEHP